jgi:hypothetical protein
LTVQEDNTAETEIDTELEGIVGGCSDWELHFIDEPNVIITTSASRLVADSLHDV